MRVCKLQIFSSGKLQTFSSGKLQIFSYDKLQKFNKERTANPKFCKLQKFLSCRQQAHKHLQTAGLLTDDTTDPQAAKDFHLQTALQTANVSAM